MRDGSLEQMKKHFTEDQIVELTLATCFANFTNRFNDALQLQPDLGNAGRACPATTADRVNHIDFFAGRRWPESKKLWRMPTQNA